MRESELEVFEGESLELPTGPPCAPCMRSGLEAAVLCSIYRDRSNVNKNPMMIARARLARARELELQKDPDIRVRGRARRARGRDRSGRRARLEITAAAGSLQTRISITWLQLARPGYPVQISIFHDIAIMIMII